jgi:hypothetical protein
MRIDLARAVSLVAVALLFPVAAWAQDATGPIATSTFSIDPDTRWSMAAWIGYRVSPRMSFGMDLTWTSLKYQAPADSDTGPLHVAFTDADASLVTFAVAGRVDVTRRRLAPYIVFGGGITADSAAYTVNETILSSTGTVVASQWRIPFTQNYLSLIGGGGLSINLNRRVSIDLDARALYMRNRPEQLALIGSGAT